MREFSVLIRSSPEIEGEWIAHCLNWDLVTQGSSPSHARHMIFEAIILVIEEDLASHLDPADRAPAPAEFWDLFAKTQQNGTRISPADIDNLERSRGTVIAAVLYVGRAALQPAATPADPLHESVPPPFMIAAFQDGDSPLHR